MANAAPETIDALLKRLCDEHDLTCLQLEFRKGRDGRRDEDCFDATAIWDGFSTSGYSNCTEYASTGSAAIAGVLAMAKVRRSASTDLPATILAEAA